VVVVRDSDAGQKTLVADGGPAVYKATVRILIRRAIRSLNQGHYQPALAMFASDADLTFPGDNALARQHRTPERRRAPFPTHRGRDEIEAFLRRYVEQGNQMEIEDILVNGPPWNTRAAVRAHLWISDTDGNEIYTNRLVMMVRSAWGKIRSQEDYEDTERVAAFYTAHPELAAPEPS
jgi:ketosteroid isomerase-like protein